MDLVEIAPGLHRLRVPTERAHLLNAYLWLGPDSVTLIDTGWPGTGPLLSSALSSLGRRPADVERIVLTHFHDDHAGSAAEIASWSPGITVVAGRADADVVRGLVAAPQPVLTDAERAILPPDPYAPGPAPCRVDREADDGDTLDLGGPRGEAIVLGVGGHTPGSIALHLPALGALLTGDLIAELHGEVILGTFHVDRAQVRRSADRMAATGAAIAGFGHGEAVRAGAADRIARCRDAFA